MSYDAISAISAIGASATGALGAASSASSASSASTAASSGASGALFGTTLSGQIDSIQAMESKANTLAVQAVTGDLDDIHDYTIAATEASVALELTAALRNKAVEAFTEIMRMQA